MDDLVLDLEKGQDSCFCPLHRCSLSFASCQTTGEALQNVWHLWIAWHKCSDKPFDTFYTSAPYSYRDLCWILILRKPLQPVEESISVPFFPWILLPFFVQQDYSKFHDAGWAKLNYHKCKRAKWSRVVTRNPLENSPPPTGREEWRFPGVVRVSLYDRKTLLHPRSRLKPTNMYTDAKNSCVIRGNETRGIFAIGEQAARNEFQQCPWRQHTIVKCVCRELLAW